MNGCSNTCGYDLFLIVKFFVCRKISWWSDIPTSMTPFWETLEVATMWSIRVEVLQVTRVGDFISCFKPCIVQNWWQFLISLERNFEEIVLSLWTMYLLFWYMFILKSPRIYDSLVFVSCLSKFAFIISRKLLWLGSL